MGNFEAFNIVHVIFIELHLVLYLPFHIVITRLVFTYKIRVF